MMDFMLDMPLPKADSLIHHQQKILSIGSCFTEHIGTALSNLKFDVLQNPNGILFDPISVCQSLVSYIQHKKYGGPDLFFLNELWHSWHHHSRFSGTDKEKVIANINQSQEQAYAFLHHCDWLIITLGSAFSYRLSAKAADNNIVLNAGAGVANCHRAPAQWFTKHLSGINEIIAALDNTIHQLFHFNPKLKIIFTISPVRHIRDGVVDNNRSKSRLIEAVHHLVNKFSRLYYFPSYELVIDVLRDYRFYAEDMVHPNYLATDFVLEKFLETFTSNDTLSIIDEIKKINIARKHKSFHPHTEAHQKFLSANLKKVQALQQQYPYLNFEEEINYFQFNNTVR